MIHHGIQILIQNSCLFKTIEFLVFFTLLRSIYRNFSLAVNSDRKTDLTVRSVERGDGVPTPSRGVDGDKITFGEPVLTMRSSSRGVGDKESGVRMVGVKGVGCVLGDES